MSSDASKKLIMLELDAKQARRKSFASVEWNPELGQKLKYIRGKVSRRVLAAKVMDKYEYKVSQQYIQLLEHPEGSERAHAIDGFI
jgi:hypothetical protein